MGEAKRRKATDPNYGKSPGNGLVVCAPVEVNGDAITFKGGSLDPQELRASLLFWDRLVWPQAGILGVDIDPEGDFLETAGILTRPRYSGSGDITAIFVGAQLKAFQDLDAREPGSWALAEGERSFLMRNAPMASRTGASFELIRAVPVPDADVPLEAILEFKQRRSDELLALRAEIDRLALEVGRAEDQRAELEKHVAMIDQACADVLRVSSEWQFPVRLSNLKPTVELRPFVTGAAGIGTMMAALERGLPISRSILAGLAAGVLATAPAFKWSGDIGFNGLRRRASPYRYVRQYHAEVF